MNSKKTESTLRKYVLLLLLMAVPAFAWAQQKKTSAPPPAPKPSAPAHNSAPSAHTSAPTQHTTTPSHTTAPTHTTTPGHSNTTTTPGHTTGAGHTTAAGHTTPTTNTHGATNMGKGPAGTTHAAGNVNHAAMNRTPPGKSVTLKGGGTASIRPNGQIRAINRNGMQIQHGLHGGRTIVSTRNGARVVTVGRRGGYVQRAYFARGGRTYVSRTYVVNNVAYVGVYRSYGYGGYCCYYGYAPAYYYNPGYYGWAYNPWAAPVTYGWGWGGSPWYGYYGAYYQPYPVYPSAAFWLTDYLLAASLQAAYTAQVEENGKLSPLAPDLLLVASMGPIPAAEAAKAALTPEVKNLLAEEVKAQLAADKDDAAKSGKSSGSGQETASGPPPALDPKRRVFVVSSELSVVADGEECSLTSGDVISRESDTPDDDRNVDVKILASTKTDCAVGKTVSVSVDDLQEMHNKFREQITGGMDELSKKQGTGGLPKAPDTSKVDGEVPAPPADSSATKALQEQQAAADKTEADVKQEAGSSGGGSQ